MRGTFCVLLALVAVGWAAGSDAIAQGDGTWYQWRGPNGDNHAADSVSVPTRWNLETGENVAWKTALPGRGHSTPIVTEVGIFLTTADAEAGTQSVLKIDVASGRLLDEWVLHRGTLPPRIHPKNSHASPSMAFDGEQLYASFHTDESIYVTALSPDGAISWQRRVCEFRPDSFRFGYGASPIVEEDLVIVAAEYDGRDSGIYALDRRSGQSVWKIDRPQNLNFSSPIVANITGERQLLIAGADMFCSYDPLTGNRRWRVDTTTEAICGTAVWDGRRAMVSGGNPAAGTWCVTADGREKLLWSNPVMCYEQSLLAIRNHVFAVADNGVAYCWRTRDGKATWKERLFGGGISASPLLVDGRLIVATERGEVYVIAALPDRFELVSENQAGDSVFASPVAVSDRLYLRSGIGQGPGRREYLIAIGQR